CRHTLISRYRVDAAKIRVVVHGVPDVARLDRSSVKRRYGLEGAAVLATFGLLSPGKGIETIVEAMPRIVERHPNALYILWGETHPEVVRQQGERYRDRLLARAREIGVGDQVRFVNRYLPDDEVVHALLATDVYVSPSLDPNQAVSGTLSYAVAAGRAVIATPSRYARELLSDGRGILVPFQDSRALAGAVDCVLGDDDVRSSLQAAAYRHGRNMLWPKVAAAFREALIDASAATSPRAADRRGA
ncbi:MAG TPA: glycosyltransferase, partial [Candidatus Eremiobacteraceae bacterium]|nr:glycosyltransferase [Candidatus Eremiobacteraceae bacterium]